jgi:hypothetical protein
MATMSAEAELLDNAGTLEENLAAVIFWEFSGDDFFQDESDFASTFNYTK